MSVYKIVSTGSIDSLSLFKHLLLGFLGDIDVIKLPPHFCLNIIHITVIVTHFCTAFMYQNRIQYIRLSPYRFITFLNILFNTINSFFVIIRFFLYLLMVRLKCIYQLWANFILEFWEYQWLLLCESVLLKLHLICLWFEKVHCDL